MKVKTYSSCNYYCVFQMHADAWGCPIMPQPLAPCPPFPQVSVLDSSHVIYMYLAMLILINCSVRLMWALTTARR